MRHWSKVVVLPTGVQLERLEAMRIWSRWGVFEGQRARISLRAIFLGTYTQSFGTGQSFGHAVWQFCIAFQLGRPTSYLHNNSPAETKL